MQVIMLADSVVASCFYKKNYVQLNPLTGKLCNSALKNPIFNTHDTLWIVNKKTTFLIWSCDLNFHTEL